MGTLPSDQLPLFYLALCLGLWMAWGIGANDFSNVAGPAIGAKVIGFREAVVIVILFEVGSALLGGAGVAETLRTRLIAHGDGAAARDVLVYGMLASLLAAALWLTFASARGWPVSTTHSIFGAMTGFALVAMGSEAMRWERMGGVAVSWLVSPVVGGIFAYLLMKSIAARVLGSADPAASARRWVPLYIFLAAFLACVMTFFQVLRPLGMDLTDEQMLFLAGIAAAGLALMGLLAAPIYGPADVEQAFAPVTLITLCSMAFVHGSNDVANVVGPLALALGALGDGSDVSGPPFWLFILGGFGIALGMATFGSRVARTMGQGITLLSPCRAFCIGLSATATILFATNAGFSVSTTHTVVGAVFGVGLAGGRGAIEFPMVGTIFKSWLVTLPLTATLAGALYLLLRYALSG